MATVPIEIKDGSILVHASVNSKDIVFIVDTGDSIGPVFNSRDAKDLDLPSNGPLQVSGAGGVVEAYSTMATLSLGGYVFENEASAVDPNLQGPSLLGLPFFINKGGVLAFDFTNMSMTFGSPHIARHHKRLDMLLEEWIHHDNPNIGNE